MTLVLWKAPAVYDPDGAEALLQPYYEREDESGFAPSATILELALEHELVFYDPQAPDIHLSSLDSRRL